MRQVELAGRVIISNMKSHKIGLAVAVCGVAALAAAAPMTRSLLVHPDEFTDKWIDRAAAIGLDVLAVHPVGGGNADKSLTNLLALCSQHDFRARVDRAIAKGLTVEYECHAGTWLLPRDLFREHPEYFRMDESGKRVQEVNFCPSSPEALEIVARRARELARGLYRSSSRHYFWLDDVNMDICKCPKCLEYSASDLQLKVCNRILAELRKDDPKSQLAFLAYCATLRPPTKVKPAEGIFLEYAPIGREWDRPASEQLVVDVKDIRALLDCFGRKDARVLEYWYDNSLFSRWTKPPKKFAVNAYVMRTDVVWYRELGFESIASFACYLGDDYEKLWGEPDVSDFTFDPCAYVPTGIVRLFAKDDDTPPEGSTTYIGWVRDENGGLKGTIIIKIGKPGDGGVFKPTVTWTPIGGRKKTVKILKEGYPTVDNPVLEIPGVGEVHIGGQSVGGVNVDVQASADFSKNKARKADYNTRLARKAGTWTFAFVTDQGPATFSVTVSKKGKGKLTGFLPDGTKVSASAQGALGDSALAIPFAFGKKAPCGFVFWVQDDGTADVSDFSRLRTAKAEFEIAEKVGPAALHAHEAAMYRFVLDETAVHESVLDAIGETFRPISIVFNGKKFDMGKAAKVTYKNGEWDVKGDNVSGLKLAYSKGELKGSFTIYAVTGGKLVKNKFTVSGVMVNDVGYATATNKKLKPIPVGLTN